MPRLKGWDYRSPYHYMVTIKRLPELRRPLSVIDLSCPYGIRQDGLVTALSEEIFRVLREQPGLESVTLFVIMPDHLHILFRLNAHPERESLPRYVQRVMNGLRYTCREAFGLPDGHNVFETAWHDIVIRRAMQLPRAVHYIRTNPQQAVIRRTRPERFTHVHRFTHWTLGGMAVDLLGEWTILAAPMLLPVRLSRSLHPGTEAWAQAMLPFARWQYGAAAVGTWWSPAEKEARRLILSRGGRIVFLDPCGIGERWHPAGIEAQQTCADGRTLYLSPYPYTGRRLSNATLRQRCEALNALAVRMAGAIPPRPRA